MQSCFAQTQFNETVFGGSHRRPVALGTRRIAATVIRDSYGAGKQQHRARS